MTKTARDAFCGVGWAVAARQLGIEDHGVDNDPAVVATREHNGFMTIGSDVTHVEGDSDHYDIEIGSPPCERFSTQGHGDGVMLVPLLLKAVAMLGEGSEDAAFELLEGYNNKIALVLDPLRILLKSSARHAVWEQVPSVLPIWAAAAKVLARRGWSVQTGMVDAAWYGTPQNRRRAVMVARRDGKLARIPAPTALVTIGETFSELPGSWLWRSNYSDSPSFGTTAAERGRMTRRMDQQSGTITRKAWNWQLPNGELIPAPVEDSARLQGFPRNMQWVGTVGQRRLIVGNAVPVPMAVELLRAAVL